MYTYSNNKFKLIVLIFPKTISQMRVIDVCCRWPGSAHDATIFANSMLCNKFEMGVLHNDSLLVADSAYGPNHYVCKPLDNPQTVPEKRYQKAQIKTRNVAERGYGGIKRQFACLQKGFECKLEKVQDVVVACCVCYNMIKMDQPNQNEPTQEERDFQTNIGARLIAAREGQRNPYTLVIF